jgi:hypothetical protein
MNDLELAVQPYAKRLFSGRDLHMPPELASTVATWITKSAMVRDAQDGQRDQAVTQEGRNWIRTHLTPPPATSVWIACLHVDHGTVATRHVSRFRAPVDPADPLVGITVVKAVPNAFVTTFSFHRLVLFVAGGSAPHLGPLYDPSVLFPDTILRIWPDPAPCHWPPRRTISNELVVKVSGGEGIFTSPAAPALAT